MFYYLELNGIEKFLKTMEIVQLNIENGYSNWQVNVRISKQLLGLHGALLVGNPSTKLCSKVSVPKFLLSVTVSHYSIFLPNILYS